MFKGIKEKEWLLRVQNTRDRPVVQPSQKQYLSDECISLYLYKSIYTHLGIYIFLVVK